MEHTAVATAAGHWEPPHHDEAAKDECKEKHGEPAAPGPRKSDTPQSGEAFAQRLAQPKTDRVVADGAGDDRMQNTAVPGGLHTHGHTNVGGVQKFEEVRVLDKKEELLMQKEKEDDPATPGSGKFDTP